MKKIRPGQDYIPVAMQNISWEDKHFLHQVVEAEQYAAGPQALAFRHDLQNRFGSHAFLVNSGSSALLAALTAARELYPDKRYVLTSALGFPTTVSTIYQAGFQPWYLDCDPHTLHVPHEVISDCLIEGDVAGIVMAHTLGFPFDAPDLMLRLVNRAAEEETIAGFLVEDACDAWGAEIHEGVKWRQVGTCGNMSAFSLYPAHHISAGEGGVVLCNSSLFAPIIRSIINWGRDCICEAGKDDVCGRRFTHRYTDQIPTVPDFYDHKYVYNRLGYNLHMTEFSAVLGRSQLSRLSDFTNERRLNYWHIREALGQLKWLEVLPKYPPVRSSPFGVPIALNRPKSLPALINFLEKKKIGTRRMFGGTLPRQPAFSALPCRGSDIYPGSDHLMEQAFWIGCWPGWTDALTSYVYDTL